MSDTITTVRFSKSDQRNIATIIKSGAAKTASAAIRVALYEAAERRNRKDVA